MNSSPLGVSTTSVSMSGAPPAPPKASTAASLPSGASRPASAVAASICASFLPCAQAPHAIRSPTRNVHRMHRRSYPRPRNLGMVRGVTTQELAVADNTLEERGRALENQFFDKENKQKI